VLRVETTATAALAGGDVDGAYVAAYDAYRMAAEALLARQALRATGGDGSHMAVEDAVSAQFRAEIPAFREADIRAAPAGPPLGTILRSFRGAAHRIRRYVGHREGEGSAVGSEGTAGGSAAGAVRLVIRQQKPQQGAAGDRVVKGAGS